MINRRITIFSFLKGWTIGIVVLTSCSVMPSHTQDMLLFAMEKTACMGTCPVYTLKVYTDGWASLDGRAHVPNIGRYETKLSPKEISAIIEAFEVADFYSLEEKYYASFSDLPTTYLLYNHNGKSKSVMDYYGAPEQLKQLESYLDSLLKKKWKKQSSIE